MTLFASERLDLFIEGQVAVITFVREERMNAIDETMHEDLGKAFATIADDRSVRAVILTGKGKAFSAGQDLGERAASFDRGETPDLYASLDDNYNPLVRTIAQMPIPVISAVNGIAFGAGAAIAICCDLVVAAESARFQFGFVNVGLGPDGGASWTLPRLVGQARAMDLALTGRPVSAQYALAVGLVSRVVADDELAGTAREIAVDLAARSPDAIRTIKRQIRKNPLGNLNAALDAERDAQSVLARTTHYREAVLRFVRRSK